MIAFRIESSKSVTFTVSVLVVDRSVGESGETPWYVQNTETAVWMLYDCVHPHKSGQVWGFFFLSGGLVFYKAASTKKKLLCKSHSSLNSEWWAVVTLKPGASTASPTFSKKSVIHAVVNVFFFLPFFCFFFCVWFAIHNYCAQVPLYL